MYKYSFGYIYSSHPTHHLKCIASDPSPSNHHFNSMTNFARLSQPLADGTVANRCTFPSFMWFQMPLPYSPSWLQATLGSSAPGVVLVLTVFFFGSSMAGTDDVHRG